MPPQLTPVQIAQALQGTPAQGAADASMITQSTMMKSAMAALGKGPAMPGIPGQAGQAPQMPPGQSYGQQQLPQQRQPVQIPQSQYNVATFPPPTQWPESMPPEVQTEPQTCGFPGKPEVSMMPVRSSNIRSVGYDQDAQALHIQFKGGPDKFGVDPSSIFKYVHSGVSPDTFSAFMQASSKGSYYHKNIKKTSFQKVRIPLPPL